MLNKTKGKIALFMTAITVVGVGYSLKKNDTSFMAIESTLEEGYHYETRQVPVYGIRTVETTRDGNLLKTNVVMENTDTVSYILEKKETVKDDLNNIIEYYYYRVYEIEKYITGYEPQRYIAPDESQTKRYVLIDGVQVEEKVNTK
jgi:hypothetical protein